MYFFNALTFLLLGMDFTYIFFKILKDNEIFGLQKANRKTNKNLTEVG
jgi:hypothetical protein